MIYILLVVAVLNMIFIWFRESHEAEFLRICKFGRFEACVGIEKPGQRDFDLTLSIHPTWYFTFQLSLWAVYCSAVWNRDPGEYPDCERAMAERIKIK